MELVFSLKLTVKEKKEKIKKLIIRPNNVKIEEIPNLKEFLISPKHAIKELVNIDEKYIQYVKAERDDNLIKCSMHPFVQAVHMAYSCHVPLTISPDMIWYLISSATATHINQNSEELRKVFVNHEGKKQLEIRRDDFVLNSSNNPWHEVIDDFSVQIDKNTNNNVVDLLVANFSTTTKNSRVVSQMVLMDAMQKYFDYKFSTMCGIPEIRLTGTKQDWENIKTKANGILKLIPDFKIWFDGSLNEILDHFINVFNDKIDNKFWNQIYKVDGGSGGPYLSGWVLSLFPYVGEGNKNRYVFEGSWKDISDGDYFAGLTTSCFDYHMNQIPFKWDYLGSEIKMLFVGGLIGVVSDKDKALMPVFGYSIMEDKAITDSRNQ